MSRNRIQKDDQSRLEILNNVSKKTVDFNQRVISDHQKRNNGPKKKNNNCRSCGTNVSPMFSSLTDYTNNNNNGFTSSFLKDSSYLLFSSLKHDQRKSKRKQNISSSSTTRETVLKSTTNGTPILPSQINTKYMSFNDSETFGGTGMKTCASNVNSQWICYGDLICLQYYVSGLTGTVSGAPNYGWVTVGKMNPIVFTKPNSQVESMDNVNLGISHIDAMNSYGLCFFQPNPSTTSDQASIAVFQIIPYDVTKCPLSPTSSPNCSTSTRYGQPILTGDLVFLNWCSLCTGVNPTLCSVPDSWGDVKYSRVVGYSSGQKTRDGNQRVFLTQQYYGNTEGNSQMFMFDLTTVQNHDGNSPRYNMTSLDWNTNGTIWKIIDPNDDSSSQHSIYYNDSTIQFRMYNGNDYLTISKNETEMFYGFNGSVAASYANFMFDQVFVTSSSPNYSGFFNIVPATYQSGNKLFCFSPNGNCDSSKKPDCSQTSGGESPQCYGGQWYCHSDLATSCPLCTNIDICNPSTGMCLGNPNISPVCVAIPGVGFTWTCPNSTNSNVYLEFLIPGIIMIIILFIFFIF